MDKIQTRLRDAKMGSAIANAVGKLPEDWLLSINIQKGGSSISLFDPDGNDIETEQSDDMGDAINNAVAEANATSKEASSS